MPKKKSSSDSSPDDKPSKSSRRRQAQDKLELAQKLVELDLSRIPDLTLPENIHEAVIATQKIRSYSARKRQLHYLAKLLRNTDTSEIFTYLASLNAQNRLQTAHFHFIEQWRDRLLSEGQTALIDLLEQHPSLEAGRLKDLLNSTSGSEANRKKAGKALFRYLSEHLTKS